MLNQVHLTDAEFVRLLEQIITPDVFAAARHLWERNSFERDDGPLYYTLVNIKEWCKNSFEVVNRLRINTDNSYHRYMAGLLILNYFPEDHPELPRRGIINLRLSKKSIMNSFETYLNVWLRERKDAKITTVETISESEARRRNQATINL